MAFQGVNFAAQRLVPSDDGRLYAAIFEDGALHGCALTYTGSTLTMAAGHLIAGGRQIEVDASMSFPVTGAVSGFAQLVLVVDLTQTATTAVFNQVRAEVRYASSSEGFPTLQQQDINGSGSLYEAQLAIVSLGTGGITGIVQDLPLAKLKGGGAGLNFEVVGGTTQPAAPTENTIWVNTDTAISEWVFSAEQPASPTEGMVWFQTGISAAAAFNALKKNNMTVYPTGCKQYESGAWVNQTAKTYQGEKWVNWLVYLYNRGDVVSSLTGGWEVLKNCGGTATLDANAININITGTSSDDTYCCICTKNKVDVTKYSKMKINPEWQTEGTSQRWTTFGLFTAKPSSFSETNDSVAGIFLNRDQSVANATEIDLSSVSGSYYVAYRCGFYSSSNYKAKGTITEVIVE